MNHGGERVPVTMHQCWGERRRLMVVENFEPGRRELAPTPKGYYGWEPVM